MAAMRGFADWAFLRSEKMPIICEKREICFVDFFFRAKIRKREHYCFCLFILWKKSFNVFFDFLILVHSLDQFFEEKNIQTRNQVFILLLNKNKNTKVVIKTKTGLTNRRY